MRLQISLIRNRTHYMYSCRAVVTIPSWSSDVKVSWLETVIPKRSGSLVLIVRGRHRGKVSKTGVMVQ